MKLIIAIILILTVIKIYKTKKKMADSKICQEKESTVAAAAVSSPSGTKSPTTEPTNEQETLQKLKCDHTEQEKNIIEQKLLSGQYPDLATIATNINGVGWGGGPLQGH